MLMNASIHRIFLMKLLGSEQLHVMKRSIPNGNIVNRQKSIYKEKEKCVIIERLITMNRINFRGKRYENRF